MKALNHHLVPRIPRLNNRLDSFATSFAKVTLQSTPTSSCSSSTTTLTRQVNLSTFSHGSGWNLPFLSLSCVPEATRRCPKLHRVMASTFDPNYKDDRIHRIASSIRVIPDFPKPGVLFQDITTLLLDSKAFKDTIDLFIERYEHKNISVVAGIEARGFIFGPPIALAIGAKFVPLRKPNKLPGEVISEEYSLEYGTDIMEMHVGAVQAGERVLIIDDLVATGGTLCAAIKLLERVGAEVVECACVIELPELKGRERLSDKPLFILITAPGV